MASPSFISTRAHLFGLGVAARHPLALIVLNQPQNPDLLAALWGLASVRILADGAGTRLFNDLPPSLRDSLRPDLICGDLDSLSPAATAFYAAAGVQICRIESQDSTDLEKCVGWLRDHCAASNSNAPASVWDVVTLCPFSGRLDHTLQNLNSLYAFAGIFSSYTLLSPDCVAVLLPQGRSRIDLCPPAEGPTVGLIPLGAPAAAVTTHGLRWDLAGTSAFGKGSIVSTSNHVLAWDAWAAAGAGAASGEPTVCRTDGVPVGLACVLEGAVEVETSEPLIWTGAIDWRAAVAQLQRRCHAEPHPGTPVSRLQ